MGRTNRSLSPSTVQPFVYGLGEVAVRGVEFFLIPVYTRFMSQGQYGIVEIMRPLVAVWNTVCLQGLQESVLRYHFELTGPDRRRFLGQVVLTSLVGGGLLTVGVLIVGPFVSGFWFKDIPFSPYLVLAILGGAAMTMPTIALAHLQASGRHWAYAGLQVSLSVLTAAAVLYFVVGVGTGAAGQLLGKLLAAVILTVVGLAILLRAGRPAVDRGHLLTAWGYGLPLMGHTLMWQILNSADRFILQLYFPLSEVGTYALGYNVGVLLTLLITVYNRSWLPRLFRDADDAQRLRRRVPLVVEHLVLICLWLGLGLSLFAGPIVGVLAPGAGYEAAATVIPIIALAFTCIGVYQMMANHIWVSRKTYVSFIVGLVAAVINIALNLLLIPRLGIVGAAVATVISFALFAILTGVGAARVSNLPQPWGRVVILISLAAAAFAIGESLPPTASGFFGRALLLLLFGGLVVRATLRIHREFTGSKA